MSHCPSQPGHSGLDPLDFFSIRQVPIEQVLAARGIHLVRRGVRRVGPCPLHGGDNPAAFVVHTERNRWFCFTRCAAGGDVIDLVARLDGIALVAAARQLASVKTELAPRPRSPRPARPFRPFTRRLTLDPDTPLLRAKGIEPRTARHFEVGAWHGPGFLHGCVAVRLHDPGGGPLGYAGRRLDPHGIGQYGKWKFPVGLPKASLLYNLHRIPLLATQTIVLVEGPWDVLRLAQLGLPAVALLGVHLSDVHRRLLAPARSVVVLLDGDPAGRRASRHIAEQVATARCVDLPDGFDPDNLTNRELAGLLAPFFPS